jgi:hypothetical protein
MAGAKQNNPDAREAGTLPAPEPNARTTGTIAPLKVMHASDDKLAS